MSPLLIVGLYTVTVFITGMVAGIMWAIHMADIESSDVQ